MRFVLVMAAAGWVAAGWVAAGWVAAGWVAAGWVAAEQSSLMLRKAIAYLFGRALYEGKCRRPSSHHD